MPNCKVSLNHFVYMACVIGILVMIVKQTYTSMNFARTKVTVTQRRFLQQNYSSTNYSRLLPNVTKAIMVSNRHVSEFHLITKNHSTLRDNMTMTNTFPMVPSVIVFILSRRGSIEIRNVFRDIFSTSTVRFMFVTGMCCRIAESARLPYTCQRKVPQNNTTRPGDVQRHQECNSEDMQIHNEVALYNDIIIANTTDVYRKLPDKVKFMLHWGVQNTKCNFFVKIDEDHFVNPMALSNFIFRQSPEEFSVTGLIARGWGVNRDGKWQELAYKPGLKNANYPPFPLGSAGWIMSRNVAKYISKHRLQLVCFQGEDVSIGIWLDESSISHKIAWSSNPNMRNDGKCMQQGAIVVGHMLLPHQIRKCWDIHKNVVKKKRVYVEANSNVDVHSE